MLGEPLSPRQAMKIAQLERRRGGRGERGGTLEVWPKYGAARYVFWTRVACGPPEQRPCPYVTAPAPPWFSCPCGFALLFKKYIFYSFIFRKRGREREREGEKHQCVAASRAPPTGYLAHNPGMCPDWESNWQPFGS